MTFEERYAVCAAQGCSVLAASGTVSGMRQGVAFRVTVPAGKLELSVNIGEKYLPKFMAALAAYGTFAKAEGAGVCVVSEAIAAFSGEELLAFLSAVIAQAVALAGESFDNAFEKEGEPVSAYLRGVLGAFGGAVLGVLPWFFTAGLLGWQLWILGALVSTVSFFGYRYLWGAHHTRFAFGAIAVSSVIAMALSQAALSVWWVLETVETVATVGEAVLFLWETGGIFAFLQEGLFGFVVCGVALFALRKQVLVYTHESHYLRRGRKRK